jgi:hypothetical protein
MGIFTELIATPNRAAPFEDLVRRGTSIHGGKFTYLASDVLNQRSRLLVRCQDHGDSWQTAKAHFKGHGCKGCGFSIRSAKNTKSDEQVIAEATEKHSSVYTYAGIYREVQDGVNILYIKPVCAVHGEWSCRANDHIAKGSKCPKCRDANRRYDNLYKLEDWLPKFAAAHGDRYTYLRVDKPKAYSPAVVTYVCSSHGEVTQVCSDHSDGHGCDSCGVSDGGYTRTYSEQDWIALAAAKHPSSGYGDYSVDLGNKCISYTCSKHGRTTQSLLNHCTKGTGCSKCAVDRITVPDEDWLKRIAAYSPNHLPEFIVRSSTKRTKPARLEAYAGIKCKLTGYEFTVRATDWLLGKSSCAACAPNRSFGSRPAVAIHTYLQSMVPASMEVRLSSTKHRWDTVVQSKDLAVELDGIYWHSEVYCSPYDLEDKARIAESFGYRQINIWEDEWQHKRSIVERILAAAVGKSKDTKVSARATTISAVAHKDAWEFLEANHIQGGVTAGEHWGLYSAGTLVAVMSITQKSPGRTGSYTPTQMELQRYCTSANVRGGFQKLLKHVCNRPGLQRVTTFSDPRYFTGAIYSAAGFEAVHTYGPDYQYVKRNVRYPKRSRQKSWFREESAKPGSDVLFDPDMTEHDLANLNGYYRLWDRGRVRWELRVNKTPL